MDNFSGVGGVRGVVELIYIQIYVTTPTKKKVNFVVFFFKRRDRDQTFRRGVGGGKFAKLLHAIRTCFAFASRRGRCQLVCPLSRDSPASEAVANWIRQCRRRQRPHWFVPFHPRLPIGQANDWICNEESSPIFDPSFFFLIGLSASLFFFLISLHSISVSQLFFFPLHSIKKWCEFRVLSFFFWFFFVCFFWSSLTILWNIYCRNGDAGNKKKLMMERNFDGSRPTESGRVNRHQFHDHVQVNQPLIKHRKRS